MPQTPGPSSGLPVSPGLPKLWASHSLGKAVRPGGPNSFKASNDRLRPGGRKRPFGPAFPNYGLFTVQNSRPQLAGSPELRPGVCRAPRPRKAARRQSPPPSGKVKPGGPNPFKGPRIQAWSKALAKPLTNYSLRPPGRAAAKGPLALFPAQAGMNGRP